MMSYGKKKWKDSNFSPISKKFSPKYATETAIDLHVPGWIGNHLVRLEKTKKGLEYYDEALTKKPNDVNILFRRAMANVKCFEISKGTNDIENALRLDPGNINAVGQRMNYMYLEGKFEKSMLLGVRNAHIRKQPPFFSFGILRGRDTIENCIGKKAGHPLRDHYEIIRELAWQKNMSMQKGKPKRKMSRSFSNRTSKAGATTSVNPPKAVKPFRTISEKESDAIKDEEYWSENDPKMKRESQIKYKDELSTKFVAEPHDDSSVRLIKPIYRTFSAELESTQSPTLQSLESSLEDSIHGHGAVLKLPKVIFPYQPLQRKTKNIDNFISGTYLGQLFQEKKFLTALPNIPGCVGQNFDANNMIIDASVNGLYTLDTAKEILRTRKPFYHLKYQELLTKSKKVEMDKLKLKESRKIRTLKKIDQYFKNIDRYVQNMDLYHMSKTAELMYNYLKITDKEILPNKDYILCRLYKLIGDGFFLSYKFLPEMTQNQMATRMHLAMGLPIARTNSQESLCKKIIGRSFKWTDWISLYEERVKICKYTEELIWLYHELARFNIEIGKFGMAKNNAVKCTYEARKYEEFQWALNGYMLMTKISTHQKNKRDATRHLRNALSTAKTAKNEEVYSFLQSCMQVLDDYKFEGARVEDLIKQRQAKMMELFETDKGKNEALTLFEYMLSKPYQKRLPLIAGLVNTDESFMREKHDEEEDEYDDYQAPNRGQEAEAMIPSYLLPSDTPFNL